MATLEELQAARKKLDMAWRKFEAMRPPTILTLYLRIKNGETVVAAERDAKKRARYANALHELREQLAKALDNDEERAAMQAWQRAEADFLEAHDEYLEIVRWAWSAGVYQRWAGREVVE